MTQNVTNMKSEENKKTLTSTNSGMPFSFQQQPENAETLSVPAQLQWRVPNFRAPNARAVGRRWGLTCQLREVEDDGWYNQPVPLWIYSEYDWKCSVESTKTYRKYDLVTFDDLRGVFAVLYVVFMAYSCLTLDFCLFWSISWFQIRPSWKKRLPFGICSDFLRRLESANVRIQLSSTSTVLFIKTNPGGY